MSRMFKANLMALLVAGAVSGCGGGGGGSGVGAVVVSGNAATGAAIASGTVTLKCVSGTTTAATTGTDGSFTIDVSGVTLPCVGRVDYKDAAGTAQKLHTFISAKGTANITPVTELLVANLTGGTALDAFDKFDATKTKGYTAAQLTAAATAVKSYLKNTLGIDVTNLPDDPVGTKFIPQSGASAGDAFDKVLDAIQAKLKTDGKKLSDVVGAVAQSGGSGGGSSKDGPAVDKTALTTLCPESTMANINTKCKVPTSGSVANPVLADINAWVKANSSGLKVTRAAFGATLGETCTFQFETFLGIAVLSTPSMTVFGTEQMTGRTTDEVDLNASGLVTYLSAGDDFTTGTIGKLEVNFPGLIVNGGLEVIYGKGGVFLSCSTK